MLAALEGGPTSRSDTDPHVFLLKSDRTRTVAEVQEALDEAGVPYRSGLRAGRRPSIYFTVPGDRLEQAQAVLHAALDPDTIPDLPVPEPKFPRQPVKIVGALILLHFLLVFRGMGMEDGGRSILRWGGLLRGATLDEPWRLATALFLHVDLLHVFWNAASMMVFGVPLLSDLRSARTALIYFASGIGGGITALAFARAGTIIVGSSGAVAGLFGAWVVLTLGRTRYEPLTRRARFRTLGIAMLVLPSLLSPLTSTGQSVSVSSHLGGLGTGMAIGALISTGLLRQIRRRLAEARSI